jgi:PAS domain S-box-containing protein
MSSSLTEQRITLARSEDVPSDTVGEAARWLRRCGYEANVSRLTDGRSADYALTVPEDASGEGGVTALRLAAGDGGGGEGEDAETVRVGDGYGGSRLAMRVEARLAGDGGDARSPEGYFVLDDDWEFEYLNAGSEKLLGRKPQDLLGKNVWEEFPEAVGDSFYHEYRRAMETGKPTSVEDYYAPLDTVFRVNVYPSDGRISVRFRDVTEEKENEDVMRGRARGMDVGTCMLDEEGERILYADDAFLGITGYTEEEAVGAPLEALYGTETAEVDVAEVERVTEEERGHALKVLSYRADGTRFWNHLYITPAHENGRTRFLVSHRDVTATKIREEELATRNDYLAVTREAADEMISAESSGGVVSTLEESARSVLDGATFYLWDDGALRADGDAVSEKGDPKWTAFSREDSVKTRVDGQDRLDVSVEKHGVFSVRNDDISEAERELVGSLVSSAERALSRIEREEELRDLTNALRSKNEDLSRLSEIDTAVRELVKKIVKIDRRDEIEMTVCEHLLKVRDWDYVWVAESGSDGEVRERHNCGTKPEFARRLQEVVDGSAPVSEALRSEESVVTGDIASEPSSDWRTAALDEGYLSAATVPIAHGMREFGALEVYSTETDAFDGDYLNAVVDVVEVLGYAVASAERRSMVLSSGYNRLKLSVGAESLSFLGRLADEAGCEVELKAVAPRSEGAVVYVGAPSDTKEERVEEVAKRYGVRVDPAEDEYEMVVSDAGLVEHAAEVGGKVTRYSPDGEADEILVTFDLPRDVDVRDFVESLPEPYSDAELVGKTAHAHSVASENGSVAGISELPEMTDRQEDALRLAYLNGYFDWPRETDGDDLSDSMGVSRPTFHQHLREAERKVMDEMIDGT